MKTAINQFDLPLECYDNGNLDILPFGKADEKLAESNYGFIAPLDTYIWNINDIRGQNNIFQIAGDNGLMLGLHTHTNCHQPFTIDDAERLINHGKEIEHGTFISWASRFNCIFRKPLIGQALPSNLWPFYYKKVANGTLRAAYQMHSNRKSFVVLGIDQNYPDKAVHVQWPLLLSKFNQ